MAPTYAVPGSFGYNVGFASFALSLTSDLIRWPKEEKGGVDEAGVGEEGEGEDAGGGGGDEDAEEEEEEAEEEEEWKPPPPNKDDIYKVT